MSKAGAGQAVDATFDAITGSLKSGTEVKIIGFGNFVVAKRAASTGPQSAHRRADQDRGVEDAEIQGRQRPQGRRQPLGGSAAPVWRLRLDGLALRARPSHIRRRARRSCTAGRSA